jgi:hypothetical protein
LKVNWQTVTPMSKKMTNENKKIAFISCQMNTEERNDICLRLPWLAVEALIMKKRIWNSTGIWTGEIRSPFSSSFKGEWSLTSWQNYKNGPWQFAKSLQWQASWQTKPRQEGSRTIRKQQSGMSGLEWDLPNHWKASPMMKNQTAKIKKVKSW